MKALDQLKTYPHKKAMAFAVVALCLALPVFCSAQSVSNTGNGYPMASGMPRGHVPSFAGALFPVSVCNSQAVEPTDQISEPKDARVVGLAVADFTGDTHPDLATVDLTQLDFQRAQYSIEIRLSEGRRQLLTLTAPFGDLRITPRDVTGDGNLDLVVHAAKSDIPIAVFLNDGCGHFSAAPRGATPGYAPKTSSDFAFEEEHRCFSATAVSSESYTAQYESGPARNLQEQEGSLFFRNYHVPVHSPLSFGSNRAPPAVA